MKMIEEGRYQRNKCVIDQLPRKFKVTMINPSWFQCNRYLGNIKEYDFD